MNNPLCDPENRRLFKTALGTLLGGDWPDPPPLEPQLVRSLNMDGYFAELVTYNVESSERAGAWLLRPSEPSRSPLPAIAVWHQHNDEYEFGKSESAGFSGNPLQATGALLARQGYVVICPDAAGFEDRRSGKLEGRAGERHLFSKQLWTGRSLAWKNILDCRRAIDYLISRPEVDGNRIGCYGHSLGSTFTWLTGPWDERIKCMVGNCCMPSIAAMKGAEMNHSFSNTIPGLEMIGDIPDVVALIAPRRLHLNFGAYDQLNPTEYIEKELPLITEVYSSTGYADAFTSWIDPDAGHELSEGMKSRMLSVFKNSL